MIEEATHEQWIDTLAGMICEGQALTTLTERYGVDDVLEAASVEMEQLRHAADSAMAAIRETDFSKAHRILYEARRV